MKILVLLLVIFCYNANAKVVTSKGYGTSTQEALENAKKNAIEMVVGTRITSQNKLKNNELSSEIGSVTTGVVESFKILDKGDNFVVIEASVTEKKLFQTEGNTEINLDAINQLKKNKQDLDLALIKLDPVNKALKFDITKISYDTDNIIITGTMSYDKNWVEDFNELKQKTETTICQSIGGTGVSPVIITFTLSDGENQQEINHISKIVATYDAFSKLGDIEEDELFTRKFLDYNQVEYRVKNKFELSIPIYNYPNNTKSITVKSVKFAYLTQHQSKLLREKERQEELEYSLYGKTKEDLVNEYPLEEFVDKADTVKLSSLFTQKTFYTYLENLEDRGKWIKKGHHRKALVPEIYVKDESKLWYQQLPRYVEIQCKGRKLFDLDKHKYLSEARKLPKYTFYPRRVGEIQYALYDLYNLEKICNSN